MRALRLEARRVASVDEAPMNTLLAIQILLLWVVEIASECIERYSRIACRRCADVAAWDKVLTAQATLRSHVIALFAEACASDGVSILVASFLTALADSSVHIEVVTHAAEASIRRVTLCAASYDTVAGLTLTFVQVVAFFALNAA